MNTEKNYFEAKKSEILKATEIKLKNYFKDYPSAIYSVEYKQTNKHLFVLAYIVNDNQCFNTGYLMGCYSLANFGAVLYEDINVIGGKSYSIDSVIISTKNYLNYHLQEINEIK